MRPINRNLSYEDRSAGQNSAEYVFIQVLLNGVRVNAVSLVHFFSFLIYSHLPREKGLTLSGRIWQGCGERRVEGSWEMGCLGMMLVGSGNGRSCELGKQEVGVGE